MGAATIRGGNVPNFANDYERKSQDDRRLASKLRKLSKVFGYAVGVRREAFPKSQHKP
jgi:hypothetical protein